MSLFINGIGTALPRHRMSQSDAAEIVKGLCCRNAEQERLLPALYRRSGVETRSSVLLDSSHGSVTDRQAFFAPSQHSQDRGPTTADRMRRFEQDAGPLAGRAAEAALFDADIPPERITHLVTVSCSGFGAPGFDVDLIQTLNLPAEVARTHVGFMGCHGALNGLRIARAFCESDPAARVLLCAVELCSLHTQYGWDPEQIVAGSLFADGAAAVVGTAESRNNPRAWRAVASGSVLVDDSREMMTWRIGDHGFEMTLSPQVPDLIRESLRPWLERWLGEHDLKIESVGSWAVHPGGPRILRAFAAATGLPRTAIETSERVLAECGNMSSPTLLFILERLRRREAPRPCVALGFGPGLVVEAALIR